MKDKLESHKSKVQEKLELFKEQKTKYESAIIQLKAMVHEKDQTIKQFNSVISANSQNNNDLTLKIIEESDKRGKSIAQNEYLMRELKEREAKINEYRQKTKILKEEMGKIREKAKDKVETIQA